VKEVVHSVVRGVIGAMAMTGVRVFAQHADLIREDPPSRLVRKRRGHQGRWKVELVHWSMGGFFGIVYGLLPDGLRRRSWFGPVYGVLVWLSFDAFVAPVFGLKKRNWPEGRERAVFVADHVLYGFVLNEMRERPRE
jgi:uncharacterized membrane protein YagU involved in acid resistance